MAGPSLRGGIVPVTAFQQNCTLLWDDTTKRGAVIDPGGDVPQILEAIEKSGITVEKILLTHGHIDHAGGAADLRDALQAKTPGKTIPIEGPDLRDIGPHIFQVLHCPGHTPGHLVFFNHAARFAHVGDVLFQGSVGRTDFPYGDHAALIRAIVDKLLPLGDDVTFVCGHGPGSTIGAERAGNPFLR
jgi:glyoxylase-like metal-dependent hydrolase (beta-lactamase superfamily II)